MPTEDKFKDLFNNPSLENEDWLETGPELLGAITDEIYPQEKKDRRILFILFFSGLIISLLIFALFKLSMNNNDKSSSEVLSNETTGAAISSIQDEITVTSQNDTNKDLTKDEIIPTEENLIQEKKILEQALTKKNNKDSFRNNNNVQSSFAKSLVTLDSPASANDYSIPRNISKSIQKSQVYNFASLEKKADAGNDALTLQNLNLIPLLDRIDFETFNYHRKEEKISSNHFSTPTVTINKNENRPWFLEIGAGVSFAKFLLNDNYASDLNPFDFTHESAQGYFLSFSASKSISKKLDFKLVGAFENLNMNSGHNSEIQYLLNEESGTNTNTRALGMATPLGFINSEIVVERVADNVESETNLIIDLNNQHNIRLLELSGVGEYTLVDNEKFKFKPSVGFGASYIIELNNKLDTFTPQNTSFKSSTSKITADQTFINTLTPFLDLGFNINYKLKRGISTGASYRFKKNLQPVYQQADYNSTMNRQNIGLFLRFDF